MTEEVEPLQPKRIDDSTEFGEEARAIGGGLPTLAHPTHRAGRGQYLDTVISPARSPMITQGAMVLPVVTRGSIEASATRNPSTP